MHRCGVWSPLWSAPTDTSDITKQGPHTRGHRKSPSAGSRPTARACVSRGVPTRRAAPRGTHSTRGRNVLPRAQATRPRRKRECLHRKPRRLEPGAHQRPPTPPPPRGRSPAGGPGSSTATRTLPQAAPTGARAAAGSGAGAAAPAPFGSGRRHGRSSVPDPAGRERGRPGPGGSEAPAAAAFPARKPLQGRRQRWAEGKAAGQCRGNTVPPESER